MSETAAPSLQAGQPVPPLVVNVQYIKDLSFEVPNAPEIYATLRSQPQVSINLDVQARALQDGQNVYEVVLAVKAEAREPVQNGGEGRPVFIAEMQYAGVFTLNHCC
jgi:preprotein translocase subunit SecB